MQRLLSIGLILVVLAGILYSCNIGGTPTDDQRAILSGDGPLLGLVVQPQSGTYNTLGQTIAYQYLVTNTGNTVLAGNVTIADNKMVATCPPTNTVGNLNNDLDPAEIVICTSSYIISQADLNTGSVTNSTTASAGGTNSTVVTTAVQMTPVKVLELINSATPNTYNQAGQIINFAYIIKNTGTTALGPAQFSVTDDRLGKINCGVPDLTLAAGASISCPGTYTTSEGDRSASQLVFNTTASGGGAVSIQPVSVTVTNTAVSNPNTGKYTRGDTIRHAVIQGEWMLQIARCYGADFNAVKNANPQVKDPAKIWPIDTIVVPNIGSNGNIYGPPCIEYITVQSGDTWESLAQKYNARVDVMKEANQGISLASGVKLRIPLNSANGTPVPGGTPIVPIRLNFPSGSNKVTLSGTVSVSKVKERYVLTAAQGQTLSVALTAPTGGLELAILQTSGTVLKAQNATLTFNGAIPSNGDYYVDIVNVTNADRQYTLEVVLSAPSSGSERVADINTGAPDSNPSYLTDFNNLLYFRATGADNAGAELWRYDSATNSAARVKDIFPGAEGSNPSFLTEYNGALYFGANGNDGSGVELWRFNGSDVGRLTDINTMAGSADPAYMTVFNGRLYFSANSSDGTGVELWQTDGTTYGRADDIYEGAGNSNPAYLTEYKGALYFSAISNDGQGVELWKYDGTNATRVTDINPGVGNANPAYLAVYNETLYFSANAGDGKGTELWKYDGTTASLAADINVGAGDSIPAYLTTINGLLYFSANGNDGTGYELWRFNGTTASRASDINKTGDSFPSFLFVYNTQLYFQANGGDGAGKELWKFVGP